MSQSLVRDPIFLLLAIGLIVFCLLLSYLLLVVVPQQDDKVKMEKSKINSLSCQELGKWIIDNSDNQSPSYAYAQAKYLVCTHGGLSP